VIEPSVSRSEKVDDGKPSGPLTRPSTLPPRRADIVRGNRAADHRFSWNQSLSRVASALSPRPRRRRTGHGRRLFFCAGRAG